MNPGPLSDAKDAAARALLNSTCDVHAAAALGILECGITWRDERDGAYDQGRDFGRQLLGLT